MTRTADSFAGEPGGGDDRALAKAGHRETDFAPPHAEANVLGAEARHVLSLNRGVVDIAGGLAVAAAGLLFLVYALRLPPSYNSSDVGAGAFPTIAAGTTLALSLVMVVRGALGLGSREAGTELGQPLRVGGLALLICGYVLLLPVLGLYLATALFLVTGILIAGRITPLPLVIAVSVTLLLVWLLFDIALGVPFPKGLFA